MTDKERMLWYEYKESIKDLIFAKPIFNKWEYIKKFQVEYISNWFTKENIGLINNAWHYVNILDKNKDRVICFEFESLGKIPIYEMSKFKKLIKKYWVIKNNKVKVDDMTEDELIKLSISELNYVFEMVLDRFLLVKPSEPLTTNKVELVNKILNTYNFHEKLRLEFVKLQKDGEE